jgi:hypothetical protein
VIVELVTRVVAVVGVVSVVTLVKNVLTKNKLKTLDFIGGFLWSGESSAELHGGNITGISFGKHVTPKPSK